MSRIILLYNKSEIDLKEYENISPMLLYQKNLQFICIKILVFKRKSNNQINEITKNSEINEENYESEDRTS